MLRDMSRSEIPCSPALKSRGYGTGSLEGPREANSVESELFPSRDDSRGRANTAHGKVSASTEAPPLGPTASLSVARFKTAEGSRSSTLISHAYREVQLDPRQIAYVCYLTDPGVI